MPIVEQLSLLECPSYTQWCLITVLFESQTSPYLQWRSFFLPGSAFWGYPRIPVCLARARCLQNWFSTWQSLKCVKTDAMSSVRIGHLKALHLFYYGKGKYLLLWLKKQNQKNVKVFTTVYKAVLLLSLWNLLPLPASLLSSHAAFLLLLKHPRDSCLRTLPSVPPTHTALPAQFPLGSLYYQVCSNITWDPRTCTLCCRIPSSLNSCSILLSIANDIL